MASQIRCNNGHYYDANLDKCPFCVEGAGTVLMERRDSKSNSTPTPINSSDRGKSKDNNQNIIDKQEPVISSSNTPDVRESPKTVYLGSSNNDAPKVDITNTKEEPELIDRKEQASNGAVTLAGWLVVISNDYKGQSYKITFGFNTIGRAETNHIPLNFDNSISRVKHASIVYDYSNNLFFIKHEDGKYLTYLNGNVILDIKELKAFDKIKIGNTELLFVPLCGEQFKWDI